MKCFNTQCQKEIGEMLFCPYCGTKQVKPKVFCAYCGAEMDDDAVFCDNCGRKSFLVQQRELETEKKKARELVEKKAKEEADRKAREEAEKKAKEEADRKAYKGHEWVDLGLSVKWGTCNLGADSPEEPGDFFAWGETYSKRDFSERAYKFFLDERNVFWKTIFGKNIISKYNFDKCHGTVDNKYQLELCDDAARFIWGGKWRIPTDAEWKELGAQCAWTWTTRGGKNGYKVTSKTNGNSIFLPAAGRRSYTTIDKADLCGYYWTSRLAASSPNWAFHTKFDHTISGYGVECRCYGLSVRPVIEY